MVLKQQGLRLLGFRFGCGLGIHDFEHTRLEQEFDNRNPPAKWGPVSVT